MPPALRPCIQDEHAVVGPRHLAGQRHVAATDQPHSRDGLRRGATRAGRDQRRAGAREASDAVEARGLEGFNQDHGRQNRGGATAPASMCRPWAIHQEQVVNISPVSARILLPPCTGRLWRQWSSFRAARSRTSRGHRIIGARGAGRATSRSMPPGRSGGCRPRRSR
jgi:hypothetical protein